MENTSSSIRVGVIDCLAWNLKQKLVRISEDDMFLQSIDTRKRYVNRNPECWIFVDTVVVVPNGVVTLKIVKNGEWKNYFYDGDSTSCKESVEDKVENLCETFTTLAITEKEKTEVKEEEEERCWPHLFRPSIELKILYCEKCGKVVFIENVGN